MPETTLSIQQVAALRAIDEGRIPAEETIIARLRRKGLVGKSIFESDAHRYFLTDEGRRVLALWS